MDRFDAASVLRGKLCGGLLAFAVALAKGCWDLAFSRR